MLFFLQICRARQHLHSFPTRRSSDLLGSLSRPPAERFPPRFPALQSHGPAKSPKSRPRVLLLLGRSYFRRHRSEEHTSELQSLRHLVCRRLLEKKNIRSAPVRILDIT